MKTIVVLESKPKSVLIEKSTIGIGNFIRQNPGAERYGHVEIVLEPSNFPTFCVWFSWEVSENVIPIYLFDHVLEGIKQHINDSSVFGDAVLRKAVIRVVGGSYHEVDSSPMAYLIAGKMAIKDALIGKTAANA